MPMRLLDRGNLASALLTSAADILEETGEAAILLDLDSLGDLPLEQCNALELWCRQQPCPVIGIGPEASSAVNCADAVVSSATEMEKMLNRIRTYPQASTVLVQVLRTVEHLPAEAGLVVESLAYSTLQSGVEFQRWLAHQQHHPTQSTPANSGPAVLTERRDDQLFLTLNRPESDNAYSIEMRDALAEAFNVVALDQSIAQVHVSAAGRCFCTGGELAEFGQVSTPAAGHMIRSQISPARLLLSAADRYHFHVHKACVGSGIELPACANYLSADPKTTFWLPELAMGLIPGAGGCVSLSRRIGRQRTAYMVLMNKKIDAKRALEWGLIDAIASR